MQTLFTLTLVLLLWGFMWLNEAFTFNQLGVASIASILLVLIVTLISISRRRQ
jgi:hypothetical protein